MKMRLCTLHLAHPIFYLRSVLNLTSYYTVPSFSEQVERSALQSATNRNLESVIKETNQIKCQLEYQMDKMIQSIYVRQRTYEQEKKQHEVSQTGQSLTKTGTCFCYGKTVTVSCIYKEA
jgi:hypothetical protein